MKINLKRDEWDATRDREGWASTARLSANA